MTLQRLLASQSAIGFVLFAVVPSFHCSLPFLIAVSCCFQWINHNKPLVHTLLYFCAFWTAFWSCYHHFRARNSNPLLMLTPNGRNFIFPLNCPGLAGSFLPKYQACSLAVTRASFAFPLWLKFWKTNLSNQSGNAKRARVTVLFWHLTIISYRPLSQTLLPHLIKQ